MSDVNPRHFQSTIAEQQSCEDWPCECVDRAPMGIFRLSSIAGLPDGNLTLARMLGFSLRAEMLEFFQRHHSLFLLRMLPLADRFRDAEVEDSLPFEMTLPTRDGTEVLIEGRARGEWDELGNLVLLEGFVTDTSWRRDFADGLAALGGPDSTLQPRATTEEPSSVFNVLMNSVKDAVLLIDLQGRILQANVQAVQLLGVPEAAHLIGQLLVDQFLDPHSVSGFDTMKKVLHSTSPTPLFHLRGRRDGSILAELRLQPVRDSAGKPEQYIAVLHPVARDQEDDRYREEQERFFTRILDTTPDVVYIHDLIERRTLFVSPQFYTLFGYTHEEVDAMRHDMVERLVHPEDQKEFLAEFPEPMDPALGTLAQEKRYRIRHADGEWKWVFDRTVLFSRTPEGQPRQVLGILTDITREVEAGDALAVSERKFRDIFTMSPVAMALLDPDTLQILGANHSFCDMLGFEERELIQYTIGNLSTPEDLPVIVEARRKLVECRESGFPVEHHMVHRNGETLLTVVRPILIGDPDQAAHVVAVVEDITERRRNNDRLRQYAQDLKELNVNKDKFFSIISHDLRSPFSTLLGYAEFLIQEFDSFEKEDMRPILSSLYRSAHNVFDLLENLLFWTRLQQGKMVYQPIQVELVEIVEKIVSAMRGTAIRKDISLQVLIAPGMSVYADANMLQSILLNLIGNAIKFTPPHGQVRVEAFRHQGQVYLRVVDTGVGMKEEELERLFKIDATFSRSGTAGESGTGLGLLLCHEMVKKNNGNISVQSTPGKGSTFEISLPALDL